MRQRVVITGVIYPQGEILFFTEALVYRFAQSGKKSVLF
jgi:hypothetical protein